MILDRYFDLIEPDLILWQYCENDFINNSAELESESRINNNGLVRPYWESDRTVYVLPKKYTARIRRFAVEHSRLMYFVINRVDRAFSNLHLETVEAQIFAAGAGHPGLARSFLVTDDLMSKVRARVGQVPVVAFNVGGGYAVYTDAFRQISSRHGILFLDDMEEAIGNAENKGIVVRAGDRAHWNETGHQIAGETLANYLTQLCLENDCKPLSHKNMPTVDQRRVR
jgi:glycosyltransferase involved in cell wall biosynthesis